MTFAVTQRGCRGNDESLDYKLYKGKKLIYLIYHYIPNTLYSA